MRKYNSARTIARSTVAVACILHILGGTTLGEGPIPIGESTTTISYHDGSGVVSFSGDRAYLLDATGPGNATILDPASNIKAFNSVNSFGRRTFLASNQVFSHVLGPDETLMTHALFKIDNSADFFSGIVEGGDVTISVEGIQFAEPVVIDESTFMLHALWRADQADQLGNPYINTHNHHTDTDPFRDFGSFVDGGVFSNFPFVGANYTLDDVSVEFTGSGTETLGLSITFPYELLKSLEESSPSQSVPGGLPAPHGFLEPFHFHLEYVVPEPATLVLLLGAMAATGRHRRRGSA